MERLTEKCWRNLDPWECCGQDNFCKRGCHDKGGCINGCIVPKLYCKLAKYEEAEEQGLLLRLPCKVGDTVYFVDFDENEYDEAIVESIEFGRNGFLINSDCEIGTYLGAEYLFLTKEEAEQALKQMGE